MSRPDEEPYALLHGKCAAEIERLGTLNLELATALRILVELVPMCEVSDPTRWFAASQARAVLAKVPKS